MMLDMSRLLPGSVPHEIPDSGISHRNAGSSQGSGTEAGDISPVFAALEHAAGDFTILGESPPLEYSSPSDTLKPHSRPFPGRRGRHPRPSSSCDGCFSAFLLLSRAVVPVVSAVLAYGDRLAVPVAGADGPCVWVVGEGDAGGPQLVDQACCLNRSGDLVGAGNDVTSFDLRIFTDQAGWPVTSNSDGGHRPGGMGPVRYRAGNPAEKEVWRRSFT